MRTYLFTSGTIFALFAVSHLFIMYEHWQTPGQDVWWLLGPALIAAVGAGLAVWAYRLAAHA